MTTRAAIYVRLSDDKKKTGENVESQRAAAEKIARDLDAVIYDTYCDNSRTASDPYNKPRPEFLRLMEDAEAGRFDAVICRHADRLYRHPEDQLRISQVFGKRGIVIHQEWSGYPLDLTTPTGVLNAGIAAQVALYEINHKKERQRIFTKERLNRGDLLPGGPRPFGFEKHKDGTLTPHETEAELVRQATRHVLEGGSIGELVRSWNAQGIRTARGGEWGYTSMRALLMRWSNAGIRQTTVEIEDPETRKVRREVREAGPGTWDAIVAEEEFRALLTKLQDPGRTRHRGDTGRKHLLSHILTCGNCGQPLRAADTKTKAGKKHWFYQCAGLKTRCRLAVDYEAAEDVVVDHIAKRLATPEPALVAVTADERNAVTALHRRLSEIDEHERIIEGGGASPASKQRQLAALNDEREDATRRLASITQRMTVAALLIDLTPVFKRGRHDSISAAVMARQEVRDRFAALDLDRKRSVIRALMRVEAVPATKGVRPTKETARQRVIVTPLDLSTGGPLAA